jgi:SsrA-binding protein
VIDQSPESENEDEHAKEPRAPFMPKPTDRREEGRNVAKTEKAKNTSGEKLVVKNRRATFDYEIDDHFEAGLVLLGSEVKSMRDGKCELVDAYATVERGEAWLKQMYIGPFERAVTFPHEVRRARKLLLHAREIVRIDRALSREGYTLIPLRVYFTEGRAKVELGLAKGKKVHDKRADMAKKTAEREARVAVGRGRKGH